MRGDGSTGLPVTGRRRDHSTAAAHSYSLSHLVLKRLGVLLSLSDLRLHLLARLDGQIFLQMHPAAGMALLGLQVAAQLRVHVFQLCSLCLRPLHLRFRGVA